MTATTDAARARSPGPTPAPAIELREVDIVFADRPAEALRLLDAGRSREEILEATDAVIGAAGVSLAVAPGEICVLMGLSGSGKSTVLRAINGLNRVSRGAVLLADGDAAVDVATCSPEVLRRLRQSRVTMVFQQFALLPWRTVRENVGFGLELKGMAKAERDRIVDAKLAMVGLEKWAAKFAHELSGGMQQRLAIAQALMKKPRLLLLDEPFGALDPGIRGDMHQLIQRLWQEQGLTIFMVTHDLKEGFALGSRLWVFDKLRHDPQQPLRYGARITYDIPLLHGQLPRDFHLAGVAAADLAKETL